MEKILILVVNTQTSDDWVELCIEMLQCFKPSVQIISPIDRHTVARIASNEGVREVEVRERLLLEAYTYLYHLEDIFGKQDLHVTITAKEMRMPEDLIVEIKRKNPGMLIIIGKLEQQILESLYGTIHVPFLLLPVEG
jgi:hypothetical protein